MTFVKVVLHGRFAFDEGYDLGPHARTAGQVHRQGPIIFSARSLRRGWKAETDGHNVSIHEWAHVLDLADGFADGVPVDAQGEWESLVEDELQRVWILRKLLNPMDDTAATEFLIDRLKDTKTNIEFFEAMKRR